jgi:hypothetical protein
MEKFSLRVWYGGVRTPVDKSRTILITASPQVQSLLDDIARFIELWPGEFLVLEVSHVMGYPTDNDVQHLLDMIEDTLNTYLLPNTVPLNTSLGELGRQQWSVLATFEDSEQLQATQRERVWDGSVIYNTYANSCDAEYMEAFNREQAQVFANTTLDSSALYKVHNLTQVMIHVLTRRRLVGLSPRMQIA